VATGSCQVTFARLVLAWTMTAARVDSSRQRHQASENSGQTRAAATASIIAVKANLAVLWPAGATLLEALTRLDALRE
jgi:energy-coupling factor transporter ATP-binding protein EcfA2